MNGNTIWHKLSPIYPEMKSTIYRVVHPGHIYYRGSWYRRPFIRNFYALYHMPNIISSIEIWIGDSFGHFLGWKMPKMLKFCKIQFQISGQWFELGGSYFEVKIALPKASIGDLIFEKCFHWLTLVKDCCLSKYCTSQGFSWIWDQLQINTKVKKITLWKPLLAYISLFGDMRLQS